MSAEPTLSPESQAVLDRIAPDAGGGQMFSHGMPVRVIMPEEPKVDVKPDEAKTELERVTDEPKTEETVETVEAKPDEKAAPYDYKNALADITKTLAADKAEEITALPPKEAVAKLGELYAETQKQLDELKLSNDEAILKIDAPPDQWDVAGQFDKLLEDESGEAYYDKAADYFVSEHGIEALPSLLERIDKGEIKLKEDQVGPLNQAAQYFTDQVCNKFFGVSFGVVAQVMKAIENGQVSIPTYQPNGQMPATPGNGSFVPSFTPSFTPPSYLIAQKLMADEGFKEDHPVVVQAMQAAQQELLAHQRAQQSHGEASRIKSEWDEFKRQQQEESSGIRKISESSQLAQLAADTDAELEDYLADRVELPKEYAKRADRIWKDAKDALDRNTITSTLKSQLEGFYKSGTQKLPAARAALTRYKAAIDTIVSPIVEEHMEEIRDLEAARKTQSKQVSKPGQKRIPEPKDERVVQDKSLKPRVNINDVVNEGLAHWADLESSGVIPKTSLPLR
jgi:hypothetical protein